MSEAKFEPPAAGQNSTGGLRIFDRDEEFVLVRPWFSKNTIKASICAVIGSLMLIYRPDSEIIGGGEEIPVGVLAILGVFTACASYYSLAGWLNTTAVFIDEHRVHVRHRPIPWPGGKYIQSVDIEDVHHRKAPRPYSGLLSKQGLEQFEIYAIKNNNADVRLIGGIPSQEQANSVRDGILKKLKSERR